MLVTPEEEEEEEEETWRRLQPLFSVVNTGDAYQLHLHKVDPANRNSQLETALDLASFEPIALETRCLVFEKASLLRRNLKTVGLFEKKLAGWVAGFITVCLQPRWLGQKTWVLIAGSTLSAVRMP